jgi:hypothetical protein
VQDTLWGKVMDVKLYEKSRSLERMFKDCRDRETPRLANIIKTAAENAWFCDGSLITFLTTVEQGSFNNLLKKMDNPKRIYILPLSRIIGKTLGAGLTIVDSLPRETEFPYRPPLVRLENNFKESIWVRTWMLATLLERHPNAKLYMGGWYDAAEKPIIFAEKNYIVAQVTPFNLMR